MAHQRRQSPIAYTLDEVKKGNMEEFDIKSGDIMKIATDGSITADKFKYSSYSSYGKYDWWRYGMLGSLDDTKFNNNLKSRFCNYFDTVTILEVFCCVILQ